MFKLKVVALYFLLTVLAVAIGRYAVDEGVETAKVKLNATVSHGFDGFQNLRHLQALAMHNAAERLATSELSAHMRTLDDFRADFVELERELYTRWPESADSREEAERAALRRGYVGEHAAFVGPFVSLLADRLEIQGGEKALGAGGREAFLAKTRETLLDCAAVAMNRCFFKLTYEPMMAALERTTLEVSGPFEPDLVIVVDRRGTGWANSQNALWSDQTDFAETHPVVREIATRGIVDDFLKLGPEDAYHFVTGMAMHDGERYVGGVIVGVRADGQLARALASTMGMEVAFVVGGHPVASSIQSGNADYFGFVSSLIAALPAEDRFRRAELRGDGDWSGVSFYYHRPDRRFSARERGAFVPRKIEDLQVVLAIDQASALAGLSDVGAMLPFFGLFLFGFGAALFFALIRKFTQPFEEIEQGIHEVLSGNKDWEFRVEGGDELPRNMAQNLRLMVASLNGKSLETVEDQVWPKVLLDEELDDSAWTSPADWPDRQAERSSGTHAHPERYYRTLYAEFLEARKEVLGESGVPMPFETFVALVDNNERKMRETLACREVEFSVQVEADRVVLTPKEVR
jgi:hypothetical protein